MSIININGTVALFFANFLGKVFGAIYRIPLSNFIGVEGMGLYQMAFPIYSFLLTMITGGISITLTRKIAKSRACGDLTQIQKDFKCAKRISLYLGLILFVGILIFAYPISIVQGNINAVYGYFGISLGFVFACLLGAYRGYYQGFGNMIPTAISQLVEQLAKLFLGLLISSVLVRYGVVYGVFGAVLGVSLSELICFIFFLLLSRKNSKNRVILTKYEYKTFFKESLPIGISYGMMPLSSLIDSLLIINLLNISGFITSYSTSLYGLETGMVLPLINMPNVLISAIAICAIPELTFKKESNENLATTQNKIFRLAYMFILPCAFGLFLMAEPILKFVYPTLNLNMLNTAVILLKLSVFEMFFMCFVTISNASLQAIGKTKQPIYSLGVGVIIKILLSVVLVTNPAFNIYGLVIASIFGYFVTAFMNVSVLKKESCFSLKVIDLVVPLFSCIIMSGVILSLFSFINGNSLLGILAIIGMAVILYVLVLIIFKQFSLKELKNLLQNSNK